MKKVAGGGKMGNENKNKMKFNSILEVELKWHKFAGTRKFPFLCPESNSGTCSSF